jgi:hypothetical protein
MFYMRPIVFGIGCLLLSGASWGQSQNQPAYSSYDYQIARSHAIEPRRWTFPIEGVRSGARQIHLKLIVSSTGDVTDVQASGGPEAMKLFPQVEGEIRTWKFMPFEKNGKAETAEVEEYIRLVPPERIPANHVTAPVVRPDSKVSITLKRLPCYGMCASYSVTVSTDGIIFEGYGFVVAPGKHIETADANEVRKLAKKFVTADFYSMEAKYSSMATDMPTYTLSIDVDGDKMMVLDYVGEEVGMPAVISELERDVDGFARTKRWIEGDEGLVQALKAEGFNFQSAEAQEMLKQAERRGKTATVQELVTAGVRQ